MADLLSTKDWKVVGAALEYAIRNGLQLGQIERKTPMTATSLAILQQTKGKFRTDLKMRTTWADADVAGDIDGIIKSLEKSIKASSKVFRSIGIMLQKYPMPLDRVSKVLIGPIKEMIRFTSLKKTNYLLRLIRILLGQITDACKRKKTFAPFVNELISAIFESIQYYSTSSLASFHQEIAPILAVTALFRKPDATVAQFINSFAAVFNPQPLYCEAAACAFVFGGLDSGCLKIIEPSLNAPLPSVQLEAIRAITILRREKGWNRSIVRSSNPIVLVHLARLVPVSAPRDADSVEEEVRAFESGAPNGHRIGELIKKGQVSFQRVAMALGKICIWKAGFQQGYVNAVAITRALLPDDVEILKKKTREIVDEMHLGKRGQAIMLLLDGDIVTGLDYAIECNFD